MAKKRLGKHDHIGDADSPCAQCRHIAMYNEHYRHLAQCFETFRAQHPKVPDDSPLHVLCYLQPDRRRPQDHKFALPGSPAYIKFMRTDDYGDSGTIAETRERFNIRLRPDKPETAE